MNPEPQIVLVADDLTGAADAAAVLARNGLVTLVALGSGPLPSADALAFSTESRHLPEDKAVERVRTVARDLGSSRAWIFKKIDSTLRGHPGAELAALMRGTGIGRALIAPAFPAQGRITIAGRQLLGGRPLEETHFGGEVKSSDLPALVGATGLAVVALSLDIVRQGAGPIGEFLARAEAAFIIADAQTDADLKALAAGASDASLRLLCGSAGLMSALSDAVRWRPQCAPPRLPAPPKGPALVIAGSRHPRTEEQTRAAADSGAVLLAVRPGFDDFLTAVQAVMDRACSALRDGNNVLITTAGSEYFPERGKVVAEMLAKLASGILERRRVGLLVLTGGDTAFATCCHLGAAAIWLRGETQPGIPHGRLIGGRAHGLPIVTKAGGFGSRDAIIEAMRLRL